MRRRLLMPHPTAAGIGNEVRVRDARPLPYRELLGELVVHREIVWTFALRDLRSRYKQTVLGLGWAVVQPLAFVVVFIVFFGEVAGFSDDVSSYAAFALSALLGWQLFAGIVSGGALALVAEAAVLRKVYFPRLAPVVGRTIAAAPNLGLNLALLVVLAPIVDGRLSRHVWWIPVASLQLALVGVVLAVPLAAVAVRFRDVQLVVPYLMQLLLFASPVAYPLTRLSSHQELYAVLNPTVGPLDAMRSVYVEAAAPDTTLLLLGLVPTLVIAVVGIEVFRRLEPGFADVV